MYNISTIQEIIEEKFDIDILIHMAKRAAYNIIEDYADEPVQILKLVNGEDNLNSHKILMEYFGLQYDDLDYMRFTKFWQLEEDLNNFLTQKVNNKIDKHFVSKFDYHIKDKSYGINVYVRNIKTDI